MAPIATVVPKIILVVCRTIRLFGRLADPSQELGFVFGNRPIVAACLRLGFRGKTRA